MTILWITMTVILVNVFFGAGIITYFDEEDNRFMNWITEDPTQGFLAFLCYLFWPIFLYFMFNAGEE